MTTQQPGPSRSGPPQELSFPVTEPVWPGEYEHALQDGRYPSRDGRDAALGPDSLPTARNPVLTAPPAGPDAARRDGPARRMPPDQPVPSAYAPQPRQGDSAPAAAPPSAAPNAAPNAAPRDGAAPSDAHGRLTGNLDASTALPVGFGEPIPYRRRSSAKQPRREPAQRSRTAVAALVTGLVLTLLSLAALVFAAVDLLTFVTELTGGSNLTAEQSAQVDSAMRQLGLSSTGTLRFYFIMAVVGGALALTGSVLVTFADRLNTVLRNAAPAAIAGGGAVLVAAAVLLMPGIPVGRTGSGSAPTVGFPLLYLVIGILLLLAGAACLLRPTARRIGLSDRAPGGEDGSVRPQLPVPADGPQQQPQRPQQPQQPPQPGPFPAPAQGRPAGYAQPERPPAPR